MTVLDDVKPGAMIRGVVPGHSVRIVSVDWPKRGIPPSETR